MNARCPWGFGRVGSCQLIRPDRLLLVTPFCAHVATDSDHAVGHRSEARDEVENHQNLSWIQNMPHELDDDDNHQVQAELSTDLGILIEKWKHRQQGCVVKIQSYRYQ